MLSGLCFEGAVFPRLQDAFEVFESFRPLRFRVWVFLGFFGRGCFLGEIVVFLGRVFCWGFGRFGMVLMVVSNDR